MSTSAATGWWLFFLIAAGCASGNKQPGSPCKTADIDEPALMEQIRADSKSDPATALAFTDEGERRFGDSSFAEERRALAIQALINGDRIGAARTRAYQFLQRYPTGPYSARVAAMTGVHVIPRGPSGAP